MQIGRAGRDIAEGRCLEGSFIRLFLCYLKAAKVRVLLVDTYAEVVVAFVGEVEAGVTRDTVGLAIEEGQAMLGALRERVLVAGFKLVEGGVAAEEGPLERRDGLGDAFFGYSRAEDLLELRPVSLHLIHRRDHPFQSMAHLNRILDRAKGLVLQRRGPPIPELLLAEKAIDRHGGVTPTDLSFDSCGGGATVGEPFIRGVTGGASHSSIG